MNFHAVALVLSILVFILSLVQKRFRSWKKLSLALTLLALVLISGFNYIIPLNPPPDSTGPMKVLSDIVFYSYETPIKNMETKEGEREIPVKVWYPENPQPGVHPLLIFSHGSFGVYESNETLYLDLASRGYIVMSLNHPHHSFTARLSDGTDIGVNREFIKSVMTSQGSEDLEGSLLSLKEWTQIRIDDLNLVLDRLLDSEKDNIYESYVDKNRIVLSGHSLGGSAALALARQRARDINALVILEAPFIGDIVGVDGDKYVFTDEPYPLPVLHIYSDALYGKMDQITTYEMNTRLAKDPDPKFASVHIGGTGHIGLTDMALVSPILTNLIDAGPNTRKAPETLLEINAYVLDFLEDYNE